MDFRSTISVMLVVLAAAGCSSERRPRFRIANPRLGAEARKWDGIELRGIRKGGRARGDRRRLVRERTGRSADQLGRTSLPRPRQGRRDRRRHEMPAHAPFRHPSAGRGRPARRHPFQVGSCSTGTPHGHIPPGVYDSRISTCTSRWVRSRTPSRSRPDPAGRNSSAATSSRRDGSRYRRTTWRLTMSTSKRSFQSWAIT